MNEAVFWFINDTLKNGVFDYVLPVFSDKDYVVIPGIAALIVLLYAGGRHSRTCVLALLIALFLADRGSEKVLKNLVKAPRPYATLDGVHLHRSGRWVDYDPAWRPFDKRKSYGFPSSHAANVAAAALVLFYLHRRTVWVTAPLAGVVGLSRVYTGDHFPLDVVGGYLWGLACGYGALKASSWFIGRVYGKEAPERIAPREIPRERALFYWLLAGWTLMNFAFLHLGLFDLAGDEAQYWDWSRRLAFGYYSKPPLIAYLIDVLTNAGGNKEWAIRSGAVMLSSGALALIYALTLRIARNESAALLASLCALAMPASWAGSVLMTPDALLIFFWALALYAFHRAVNGQPRMWYLVGSALGLGMLSKYTMALLYVVFALYIFSVERHCLRRKEPYLAVGISALCMTGVVYWNWANDWISIRHTLGIGLASRFDLAGSLGRVGTYLAGQAGVMTSPLLFAFFLWAWWRCSRQFRENRHAALLALGFGVLFVFYAVVSFTHKPEPNWPAAAYVAGAAALGVVWGERPRGKAARCTLFAALLVGNLLGVLARSTEIVYLLGSRPQEGARADRLYIAGLAIDPDADPTNALRGGRELGAALGRYLAENGPKPFLFSNSYQITALMAFYTPGRPRTYCAYHDRRMNQYDLWGGSEELIGRDAFFVTGGDATRAQRAIDLMVRLGAFERGEYLDTVEVRRAYTLIKTCTISKLHGYSGFVPLPEQRY